MQVVLRKNVKVNDLKFSKGDKGWLRCIEFGEDRTDIYLIDINNRSMVPIPKEAVDFISDKKND